MAHKSIAGNITYGDAFRYHQLSSPEVHISTNQMIPGNPYHIQCGIYVMTPLNATSVSIFYDYTNTNNITVKVNGIKQKNPAFFTLWNSYSEINFDGIMPDSYTSGFYIKIEGKDQPFTMSCVYK